MIDLTPLDVRKKKGDFARSIRGYDPGVVDGFLDLVAERMEELVRENVALKERTASLADTVGGFRDREQAMNEALVSAQQLREELRAQAARDSELLLREAKSEAAQIRAEAGREAAAAVEARRRVEGQRLRFLRNFRTFVERQLTEIEMEEERLRNQKGSADADYSPAGDEAGGGEGGRGAAGRRRGAGSGQTEVFAQRKVDDEGGARERAADDGSGSDEVT